MADETVVETERVVVKDVESMSYEDIARAMSTVEQYIFRNKTFMDNNAFSYFWHQLKPIFDNAKGDKGDPGEGFKIIDFYNTLAELQAAVTDPQPGDAYGVGTTEPYDVYIYGETTGWVNNGQLKGEKGDKGDTGAQGPKGEQGPKGDQGQGSYDVATTTANGLMSAADKKTLDSLTPMVVTFTQDTEGVNTADKTYAEVNAAYQAGTVVNGISPSGNPLQCVMGHYMTGYLFMQHWGTTPQTTNGKAWVNAEIFYRLAPNNEVTEITFNGISKEYFMEFSQEKIDASGILKGDGEGGISAAVAGTDYIATETDPTVPSWAKAASKPTYTPSEIGAAEEAHSHALQDVEGLTAALNGKAAKVHTHTTIEQLPITAGTADLTAGTSALASNTIYIMYE